MDNDKIYMRSQLGFDMRDPLNAVTIAPDYTVYETSWAENRRDELIGKIIQKYTALNLIINVFLILTTCLLMVTVVVGILIGMDLTPNSVTPILILSTGFMLIQGCRVIAMIGWELRLFKPKHKGKLIKTRR